MQDTHEKLVKATAIVEQVRAADEDRDMLQLQAAMAEGQAASLTIPSVCYQMHFLWLAKEMATEKKFELWSDLLMKGALSTPTLPRRLRDFSQDLDMLQKNQDQTQKLIIITMNIIIITRPKIIIIRIIVIIIVIIMMIIIINRIK